jgi:hypothetical protein
MTNIPQNVARYRPMTVGQVADVVGVPRETLRTWLRDEVFDSLRQSPQEGGWRRFTDFEAITIGVYGKILECSRDHDAARIGMLLAAKLMMDEWVEVDGVPYLADETFQKDRMLFFWRGADGQWTADLADMGEGFVAAMNSRIDETFEKGPSFFVINLGTILKRVLLSLLTVQIEMGRDK